MEIHIQKQHDLHERVLNFVNEKVSGLRKYNDRIMHAEVRLNESNSPEHEILCEIKLTGPGPDLFARRSGSSYEEATINTVEALEHQLVRKKPR